MGSQRSLWSPLEGFKGSNRPGASPLPEKWAAAAHRGLPEPARACRSPAAPAQPPEGCDGVEIGSGEELSYIKGGSAVAVGRNGDQVLGSTRNTLSQPVVVETGKAFLEQGLQAHVTFQRRQRKHPWKGLELCARNRSSGLESLS